MALGAFSIAGISLIAVVAVLYQLVIRDLLHDSLGVSREVQPLSDFPYQCRRLTGPGLEACEDMWLSETRRVLYLACSDSLSRRDWMPKYKCNELKASGYDTDTMQYSSLQCLWTTQR